MELNNNAKENVWMEAIRTMTEKEIAYKESIDRRIAGIKNRQVASLIMSSIIVLIGIGIICMVIDNLNNMHDLLNTLIEGFSKLKN